MEKEKKKAQSMMRLDYFSKAYTVWENILIHTVHISK